VLNERPVFLNCFTQGGSNILWNFIVSHPEVCSPTTETHSCFENGVNYGMRKNRRPLSWINFSWSGLALLALTRQPRLFDVRNNRPRGPVGALARRIIDARLHRCKLESLDEPGYRYKAPDVLYTPAEVKSARLCTKGNNGLVFLNPVYRQMYPQARFVAMVRHPLPIYESWTRRSIVASPAEFTGFYTSIAERMLAESEEQDCKLVRFEDLLGDPVATARDVYDFLELDFTAQERVRVKAKKHYRSDGTYGTDLREGEYYWFGHDELQAYFESGVSRKHVEALDPADAEAVLDGTAGVRARLAYADEIGDGSPRV